MDVFVRKLSKTKNLRWTKEKVSEEGPVHERRHFKNRDRMHYDLQEGELYSVHYDQRKELGRGKFGVVYHVKV